MVIQLFQKNKHQKQVVGTNELFLLGRQLTKHKENFRLPVMSERVLSHPV